MDKTLFLVFMALCATETAKTVLSSELSQPISVKLSGNTLGAQFKDSCSCGPLMAYEDDSEKCAAVGGKICMIDLALSDSGLQDFCTSGAFVSTACFPEECENSEIAFCCDDAAITERSVICDMSSGLSGTFSYSKYTFGTFDHLRTWTKDTCGHPEARLIKSGEVQPSLTTECVNSLPDGPMVGKSQEDCDADLKHCGLELVGGFDRCSLRFDFSCIVGWCLPPECVNDENLHAIDEYIDYQIDMTIDFHVDEIPRFMCEFAANTASTKYRFFTVYVSTSLLAFVVVFG